MSQSSTHARTPGRIISSWSHSRMYDYKSGAEQDLLCVRGSQLHLRYLPAIAHRRETGGVCLRAMRVCISERESRAGRMGVRFLCRCTANDKAPFVCPSVSDTEDKALTLLVRQVEKSGNVQRWRGVYGYGNDISSSN